MVPANDRRLAGAPPQLNRARSSRLPASQRRHDRLSRRRYAGVGLTGALLLGIYYLIPFTDRTSGESLTRP